MYIDVYCFCVVQMEELYTIAVSFGKIVHNRGFSVFNGIIEWKSWIKKCNKKE